MTEKERIESIKMNGGWQLNKFKKENITYDMCLTAVKCNGDAIFCVPEEFLTEELCLEACKNYGMALERVPKNALTENMCESAVENDGNALQYVPGKYRKKALCKKSAISSAQAYKFIPENYITPDFVTAVAQNSNYESISNLPNSFKNTSFYYELVSLDAEFIWYLPKKNLTAEIGKAVIKTMGYSSTADAVDAKPELLSKLHTSLYDHDTCLNFINSAFFVENINKKDRYNHSLYGFNTNEDKKKGRLYLNEKFFDTYSLPHIMRWPDVIMPLLTIDGQFIEYVKSNLITEQMCETAVKSDPNSLRYIIDKYKTEKVCKLAFSKEPFTIEYIPKEYITEKMALKAVKYSEFTLKYIPLSLRNKEICYAAVNHKKVSSIIKDVPHDILDKEIALKYLQNVQWGVHELSNIPEELWDYDICLAAVKKDGYDLQYVPIDYIDYNMCLTAVQSNASAAKYVPEELFTEELALITVSTSQFDFKYIPRKFVTEAVCLKALSHGERFVGTILKDIPKELITQEMCNLAVEKSPRSLEAVPDQYVTEEMLLSVAREACALVKDNFPERFRTKEFIQKLISIDSGIKWYISDIVPID